MMGSKFATSGRYVIALVDQAVLSLVTLATLIVAAQWLDPTSLGLFVFGQATAVLLQSLVRAVSGETLLVRSTLRCFDARSEEAAVAVSAGLALLIGAVGTLVCFIFPAVTLQLLSICFAQVGLLMHDVCRYVLLSRRNAAALLAMDISYLLGQVGVLWWLGSHGASAHILVTALGAWPLVVAVVTLYIQKVGVGVRAAWPWSKSSFRYNSSFVVEAALGATLGYTIVLVLGVLVSGPDLAAYRATLSIFGLTSLAINFLKTVVLRDVSRTSLVTRKSFVLKFTAMSTAVVFAVISTLVILNALPESVGVGLFGDLWFLMMPLFLAASFNRVAAGLSVIPTIFLRVQGITWKATMLRVAVTLIGFGLGPLGAYYYGASGAFWGEACTYLLLTVSLCVLSWRSRLIGEGTSGDPSLRRRARQSTRDTRQTR